jgi:hypothetical protein
MTDAHLVNIKDMQLIHSANQLVASLNLPAGSYLIFGKANAAARQLKGLEKFAQGFECKLSCNGVEDKCMENMHSEGFGGGNWCTIALNLGVILESEGKVEMKVTTGLTDGVLFFDVVISAIKIDNLTVHHSNASEGSGFRHFGIHEILRANLNVEALMTKMLKEKDC